MSSPHALPQPPIIDQKLRQAHWYRSELISMRRQISALEMQAAHLEAVSRPLEKYLQETFEFLAQSECRTLCGAVLTRMPRELRDQIYTHLLGEHALIEIQRPALHCLRDQHYMQSAYVGPQFHAEIVAAFYSIAPMKIVGKNIRQEASLFHEIEPFGTGDILGHWVRKVDLVLDEAWIWRYSIRPVVDLLTRLEEVAGPLGALSVTVKGMIGENEFNFTKILAALIPPLRGMKGKGWTVVFRHGEENVEWEKTYSALELRGKG